MIGGQIIIPIRDRSGNKAAIQTTATNIKLGTFAKIKRAIEMQKELVFNDVILERATKLDSFSVPGYSVTVSNTDYFEFLIAGTFNASNTYYYTIRFLSNDTAIYKQVFNQ